MRFQDVFEKNAFFCATFLKAKGPNVQHALGVAHIIVKSLDLLTKDLELFVFRLSILTTRARVVVWRYL